MNLLEWILVPLLGGALLSILFPNRWAPAIALASVASSGVLALDAVHRLMTGETVTGLRGALRLDSAGALVLLLVLSLGFVASLVSSQTEQWARRFYALLLTFTATMALATLADNLGLLWASVEATTLSSALLVGHRRTQQSTEAAWKYLILSSTGILFAFVATLIVVLAGSGAGAPTLSWRELLVQAPNMDPGLLRLALVLATVGYGTKAGLVPYHFWLPDAHSEAPSPVSALLSGVLLSCALLALDRFVRIAHAADVPFIHLPLTLGAISVVVGGALVLAARTYKRLLAYSSIENMGLVVFALGVGTPVALAGAYLHILAHGLSKSLAFFSAGRVHHHLETTEISQGNDLLRRTPAAGRGLFVGFLALGGLPPWAPFTSKLIVLGAALPIVAWPYSFAILLGLALAFVGFVRHAATLLPPPDPSVSRPAPAREPWTVPAALLLLVAANLVLAIAGPSLLSSLLDALAQGAGGSP